MDEFSKKLNDLLVETFWSIIKIEENTLKYSKNVNLSINEVHLIEAVGIQGADGLKGRSIRALAKELNITSPSVTVAINKLSKKGYVAKTKEEGDGRMVNVVLTEKGKKVYDAHRFFHRNMVRALAKDLTEEEKKVLVHGIERLNHYFRHQALAMEGK